MNVQPSTSRTSLLPIGLPRPIGVRVDAHGLPAVLVRTDTRGRRGTEAGVERVEDIWRVAEAWWRQASQARTYYRVILERGRPLTLFRDDDAGAWFEQPYSAGTR